MNETNGGMPGRPELNVALGRRNALFALGASACGLGLAAAPARAAAVLDLATAYPDTNFHVQNERQFAAEVADATAGAVQIRVQAGGSRLKAPDVLAGVKSGQVAMGEVFGPSLGAIHGVFGLDAVPFIVTTYGAARKLWNTVERLVRDTLAAQGLVLLASVPWPPQGLFCARPIGAADDLKGLRLRENSPPVKRLAELLQAEPVRVETPELAAAARAGRINAVFTSAAQGIDTELYQSMPYFHEANAWLPRNLIVANPKALESLGAEHRTTLVRLAARAEERGWGLSERFSQTSTQALAKAGAKIAPLPSPVRTRLDRLGIQVARETVSKGDPALLALMGAFFS
jgi:TRAP-type C4-dicarboxylate transport system substrate-binding protein